MRESGSGCDLLHPPWADVSAARRCDRPGEAGGGQASQHNTPMLRQPGQRVPFVRLVAERATCAAVGLGVPGGGEVVSPAGQFLLGLLGLDAAATEVEVQQLGGQPFAEDGVGGGDAHPHVPARMLGQVGDRPGGQLRLEERIGLGH